MPPDLNSLPPSPSPSTTPLQNRTTSNPNATITAMSSPSPASAHTPPHSLAAAATMNAGIHTEDIRHQSSGSMRRDVERARRRSSIRMNLNLNDPSILAPGEMQRSPHHERAPSLGNLHQELEYEQEGQVNRLFTQIRHQQAQIQALQAQTQTPQPSTSAVDDSTPTSSLADRSRGSSRAGSPAHRPRSGHSAGPPLESYEFLPSPSLQTRDESAFYQAETQTLTRENQMLKMRIRELERQLTESNPSSSSAHSPVLSSNLHMSPPISRRQTGSSDVAN